MFLKKDGFMFSVILGAWLMLCAYFDPRIIHYLKWTEPLWAIITVLLFTATLNLFWLSGIHQIVLTVFSHWVLNKHPAAPVKAEQVPVAILYTTKDDFQESALLSCIHQDYPLFKVFILDDSDDEGMIRRVDKVREQCPEVEILRRFPKDGFKGGNLNHCLRKIHQEYPYFVVTDADGLLPRDFLTRSIKYFLNHEDIGFVQTAQKWNSLQKDIFPVALQYQLDLHAKYFLPAKNESGFVMFYGHGAMIKTEVWRKTGGFHEGLTEDLVFSSEIRRLGFKGLFAKDIVCFEDFPRDFERYNHRYGRWIQGTLEYLFRFYPKLLIAKNVTWFEKMDVALSALRLLFPLPLGFFLLLVCLALPAAVQYSNLYFPVLNQMGVIDTHPLSLDLFPKTEILNWAVLFYVFSVIYGFAEFLGAFLEWGKKPFRLLSYLYEYTYVSWASFPFLLKKSLMKKEFKPTGSISETGFSGSCWLEAMTAALLSISAFNFYNYWLIPVAAALFVFLFMKSLKRGFWIKPAIMTPFILNVMIILYSGFSLFKGK